MSNRKLIYATVILFLVLLASATRIYSQNALYDSLKSSIDTLTGIEKIISLQNAACLFEKTSLDKGLFFARQSEEMLVDSDYDSLEAINFNIIGNLYLESGLYAMAEKNYTSSLKVYERIGDYNGKATETHNLGLSYLKRNDTIMSIDYFKQSLDARYSSNDNRRIGDGLTTLGDVYLDFEEHEKSISCLIEAIDYYADEYIYPRKFDCYAYLADNFLSIDPSKTFRWIAEMEKMVKADTSGILPNRHRIDFRIGQYYLQSGNYLESADIFNKIDFTSANLMDEFKPIETIRDLSTRLYEIGEIRRSLEFSAIGRRIKSIEEEASIINVMGEYKARLDLLSTEEDIQRTEELNKSILQRIRTERIFKYVLFSILILLTVTVILLLINFFNLRKTQSRLNARNIELIDAYEKSIAYNESIIRLGENKNVFFHILTDKLLIPFTDLTVRLKSLASEAKKSFNKKSFLLKLGNIYTISLSIEKSLKRILIWSKLQRKKYEVDRVLINVNDYLHELLPEILKMTIRKSIKVSFDNDPGLSILFDRKALRSILKILVENSINNSPKKSEIIIRSKKANNGAIISVTDYGKGITPEVQATLFDVKKRDDHHNYKDYTKLGLGLLMSKHLAELNYSYLSFESKEEKGTTFYLHIKKENGRKETNI